MTSLIEVNATVTYWRGIHGVASFQLKGETRTAKVPAGLLIGSPFNPKPACGEKLVITLWKCDDGKHIVSRWERVSPPKEKNP